MVRENGCVVGIGEITSETSDKRGERIERFLGVVTTEMVKWPVEARWWVRSKMGIKMGERGQRREERGERERREERGERREEREE